MADTKSKAKDDLELSALLRHPDLGLTAYEVRVAELWLDGCSEYQILTTVHADGFDEELKPSERKRLQFDGKRRVRWALNRVAERVAIYKPVFQAGHEFSRCVVECVRNRKDFRAPSPLVGIMPLVSFDDDRLKTPEEARKLHRNVPLRGPVMFAAMAKQDGADSLRHLASGLG